MLGKERIAAEGDIDPDECTGGECVGCPAHSPTGRTTMTMPDRDTARNWVGKRVLDTEGAALGTCSNLYEDDTTAVPEWLRVELLEGTQALVPTAGAVEAEGDVRVAVPRSLVLTAPRMGLGEHVTEPQEIGLYEHYGIPYSTEVSDTVLPAGPPAAPPTPMPSGPPSEPEPAPAGPPSAPESTPAQVSPGEGAEGRRSMRDWLSGLTAVRRATPYLAAAGGVAAGGAAAGLWVRRRRAARQPTRGERLTRAAQAALGDVGGVAARGTATAAVLAATGVQRSLGRPAVARAVLIALSGFAAGYALARRSSPGTPTDAVAETEREHADPLAVGQPSPGGAGGTGATPR
jgi:hypothetical protein